MKKAKRGSSGVKRVGYSRSDFPGGLVRGKYAARYRNGTSIEEDSASATPVPSSAVTRRQSIQSHVLGKSSTVIHSFGYDAATRELWVKFKSGRRYVYDDVPEETYKAMCASFSRSETLDIGLLKRYVSRLLPQNTPPKP